MRTIASILALILGVAWAAPVQAQAQDKGGVEVRTFTFGNGDTYTGEVRDNLPHGKGSWTTGGKTYTGVWSNGCLSTPDGQRFAVNTTLDKCPRWRKPGFARPDFK